ncbi:MAG: cache domain-containing protein [bacterium]
MRLFIKVTLLLLVVGLVQLVILSFFTLTTVEKTVTRTINSGLTSLAVEVGQEVHRVVNEAYHNILLLAQNPVITSPVATREEQQMELVKTQQFHRIFKDITLLNTNGDIRASVFYSFRGTWKSTLWFKSAVEGRPMLSDVHAVLYPYEIVMTAITPFKNSEGEIAGVLVGQIDMERIWEITRNVSVGKQGEVMVVNRHGIIVSAPDPDRLLGRIGDEDLYHAIIQREQGVLELRDESGCMLAVHVPINSVCEQHAIEWSVVVSQPKKEAYSVLYYVRCGLLLSLLACVATVMILSPLLSRRITRRVNALVVATRHLGKGEFDAQVQDLGNDEIGELGRAFNRAQDELACSQRKIHEYSEHLEELVEERTAALKATQSELIETAHLAGMAEVATGVLHNIGNAINSVNIRLRFIKETVEGLRINKLMDSIVLLESNADKLDHYCSLDPKGQKVLPYMKMLSGRMAEDRQRISQDIQFLEEQVRHICDVITLQQSYAKGDRVVREEHRIDEILMDSIRMHSDVLEKNGISVNTDFSYQEPMLLNRHQLIQVFVNLIKNASQSIELWGPEEKAIYIATRLIHDPTRENPLVEISIRDTGGGFSQEIKNQLFTFGFSTKNNGGKGFGLHFCATCLQSINGSINAKSDGPGTGATFFVHIPIDTSGIKNKGHEAYVHAQDA